MKFMVKANRVRVTAELLGEVFQLAEDLTPSDRGDRPRRLVHLSQFLVKKGLDDQRKVLAKVIDFRLTAFARLHDPGREGWTLPGELEGCDCVHDDLLRALADEPLIEDASGQPSFDAERLRSRMGPPRSCGAQREPGGHRSA
jgi:hypothetical protein